MPATEQREREGSALPSAACIAPVQHALYELQQRALYKSHAWLAELHCALVERYMGASASAAATSTASMTTPDAPMTIRDAATLTHARSLFHLHEYGRAAAMLEDAQVPGSEVAFLRLYAEYLSIEASTRGRTASDSCATYTPRLRTLRERVAAACTHAVDGYLLYLRGAVERKLGLEAEAAVTLSAAVALKPWNWGCWLELARCSSSVAEARENAGVCTSARLMGALYVAHVCNETDLLEDARKTYDRLMTELPEWPFAKAQCALVLYNQRCFDEAGVLYEELFENDPNRLDGADVYSNILFVKEDKPRLSQLANRCLAIDRVALETCVVIGNYMSLRQNHEQAVAYFKRALRLNPAYLSAWTLMGHEYVEMKNAAAAIEAYRRAVDINQNDFRAWYGLGQTYELMQMPAFTLYYFRKAASLKPKDPRMWCAVGHTYEELGRLHDALRCYQRAVSCDENDADAQGKLQAILQSLQPPHLVP